MHVLDLFNDKERKFLNSGSIEEAADNFPRKHSSKVDEGDVVPLPARPQATGPVVQRAPAQVVPIDQIRDPGTRSLELWKQQVKAAHPEVGNRLRFVSKDQGQHVSAEIPGVDRSYGVFDTGTAKGQVFDSNTTMEQAIKQRLDPSCWSNKKIGNPKTKIKGGVRVNNCVPKEGVDEAANAAQQAAIAISKKKQQGVAEGLNDTVYPNAEVIKSKNGKPVGEIYQDGNSWGAFHYRADRGYDFLDSREDAIEALKDLHQETGRSRPDYTIKGVAEGSLREDLQADDGEYYKNADQFFGQFEADHFDDEETSPDGMEIRGYIDGVNVMAWRFKSAKKIGGWGIYDDSALEQGIDEDMSRRGVLRGLGAAALGAAGIGAAGSAQGKVTFDNNGKQINPPDWKNFQGTAPAQGATPQSATATNAAPMTGAGSKPVRTADALQALSDTSKETAAAAHEAWRDGQKLKSNPKFREEYDRIEKFYDTARTGVLTRNNNFSANPDLRRRQIGEMFKMLIDLDREFIEKTNALINQYGRLKEQGVAEGERTMSRAAKGHEKYGKEGMAALARAGREGASEKKLDKIRDKHNKYDEGYNNQDEEEAEFFRRADHSSRTGIAVDRSQPGKIVGRLSNREPVQPEKEKKPYSPSTTKDTGRVVAHKSGAVQAKLGYDSDNPAYSKVSEEGASERPRIRKYSKMRPDGSKAVRYEVLDYMGRRVSGQGVEGFDDLKNAKQFYYRNYDKLQAPVEESGQQDIHANSKPIGMKEGSRYWCSTDKRWKDNK